MCKVWDETTRIWDIAVGLYSLPKVPVSMETFDSPFRHARASKESLGHGYVQYCIELPNKPSVDVIVHEVAHIVYWILYPESNNSEHNQQYMEIYYLLLEKAC